MISDVEGARVVLAIDDLKKRKNAAETELAGVKSALASAGRIYGSELASMYREEEDLANAVDGLKDKIRLLNLFLGGMIDLSREQPIRERAEAVDRTIERLEAEKSELLQNLSEIDFIKIALRPLH